MRNILLGALATAIVTALALTVAAMNTTFSDVSASRRPREPNRTAAIASAPPPLPAGPRLVRQGDAGEGYDIILDTVTGCRYLKGSYGTMLPLINGMSWPDCEPSRVTR